MVLEDLSSSLAGVTVAEAPIYPLDGETASNRGTNAPVMISPSERVALDEWAQPHVDVLESALLDRGSLLFRDFEVGEDTFTSFTELFSSDALDYRSGLSPRNRVSSNLYTSTEAPPEVDIVMHNELSYAKRWPRKVWFTCATAPDTGGETPIADSRAVLKRVDAEVRDRFAVLGVSYVRNYEPEDAFDVSWSRAFETDSKDEVDRFCNEAGITAEWLPGDRLRTTRRAQGLAVHPSTGETLWFNQASLFHPASLPRRARIMLATRYGADDLPRNAFFGDGSPISKDEIGHVVDCYDKETVMFSWQPGDVLMLDNMLVAHGRRPFTGERRVLVGMADSCGESVAAYKPQQ